MNLKEFLKAFKAYENKVGSHKAYTQLLNEVGNAAKNESTRSFERQKSPFNEEWASLSPTTLKRKKGSLKLVESGHLKRSIDYKSTVSSKSVAIGSNLKYAAIHQFGGNAGRNAKAKIPARSFLPIDKNNKLSSSLEKQIEDILDEFTKL